MTRKPPRSDVAQSARDLHAAEPSLTATQIAVRLGTYKQRVQAALKATGEKPGPKGRPKCQSCGGTGYAA